MHILLMTFILIQVYFSCFLILYMFRDKLNKPVVNITFSILIFASFAALNIIYFKDGGLDEFLTLDNISPMTFTLIPLMFLMRGKVKDCFLSMLAFLSVGMFFAALVNLFYAYFFQSSEIVSLAGAYDTISHFLCSLFGAYLIMSGQVKPDFKKLGKAMIFLYSIITFGVILNFTFHKSYFGMDPYGTASIYMFDLFSGFYPTLVAYVAGVAVVLLIGFQFAFLIDKISAPRDDAQIQKL